MIVEMLGQVDVTQRRERLQALLAAGRIALDTGDPSSAIRYASDAWKLGSTFLPRTHSLLRDAAVQQAEAILWPAELSPQDSGASEAIVKAERALHGYADVADPIRNVADAWRVAVAARVVARIDAEREEAAIAGLERAVAFVGRQRPGSAMTAALYRHLLTLVGAAPEAFDDLAALPEDHPELGWRAYARGLAAGPRPRDERARRARASFRDAAQRFERLFGSDHRATRAARAAQKPK